jgi:hypothetical protein
LKLWVTKIRFELLPPLTDRSQCLTIRRRADAEPDSRGLDPAMTIDRVLAY